MASNSAKSGFVSFVTRRRVVAGAVILWTLVAWGGRITLLEGSEDPSAWIRIMGSLLVGAAAAVVLAVPTLGRVLRPVLAVFVLWSLVVWTRALIVVWGAPAPLGFRLAHTLLAVGFYALAWAVVVSASRSHPVARPDQRDRQEE